MASAATGSLPAPPRHPQGKEKQEGSMWSHHRSHGLCTSGHNIPAGFPVHCQHPTSSLTPRRTSAECQGHGWETGPEAWGSPESQALAHRLQSTSSTEYSGSSSCQRIRAGQEACSGLSCRRDRAQSDPGTKVCLTQRFQRLAHALTKQTCAGGLTRQAMGGGGAGATVNTTLHPRGVSLSQRAPAAQRRPRCPPSRMRSSQERRPWLFKAWQEGGAD